MERMLGDLIAFLDNAAITYERTTVIALVCFEIVHAQDTKPTD